MHLPRSILIKSNRHGNVTSEKKVRTHIDKKSYSRIKKAREVGGTVIHDGVILEGLGSCWSTTTKDDDYPIYL